VLGSVALWGRTIEHELGYRSEFAYPQRLRLVCPVCFWRSGRADARPTVATVGRRGDVTTLCRSHLRTADECGFAIRRSMPAGQLESQVLAEYGVDLLPA
jgi:hypothetical protein